MIAPPTVARTAPAVASQVSPPTGARTAPPTGARAALAGASRAAPPGVPEGGRGRTRPAAGCRTLAGPPGRRPRAAARPRRDTRGHARPRGPEDARQGNRTDTRKDET